MTPKVHFGEIDAEDEDWREGLVDEDPDDEELDVSPKDVVDILGFDPKEFSTRKKYPVRNNTALAILIINAKKGWTEEARAKAALVRKRKAKVPIHLLSKGDRSAYRTEMAGLKRIASGNPEKVHKSLNPLTADRYVKSISRLEAKAVRAAAKAGAKRKTAAKKVGGKSGETTPKKTVKKVPFDPAYPAKVAKMYDKQFKASKKREAAEDRSRDRHHKAAMERYDSPAYKAWVESVKKKTRRK